MAVNPKANVDVNNLSPSPTDGVLKYDEALKAFVALLEKNEVEGLSAALADLESRATAAGA